MIYGETSISENSELIELKYAYLDNLITREFKIGDVGGIAGHQVAVQDAQHRLVRDDQKIILLTLQLENDRFKPDCEIMIGLKQVSVMSISAPRNTSLPLPSDTDGGRRPFRAS